MTICCIQCHISETISVSDGWAFTNNFDINEHRSLEDRLSAAQLLVQKEPLCPVVVDEMSDVTTIKYGALPERLYVLQAGKVVYKVRPVHPRPPETNSCISNVCDPDWCSCNCVIRSNSSIVGVNFLTISLLTL